MGKGSGRGGNATLSSKYATGAANFSVSKNDALTLVIDGRKYDMTGFDHPGGDNILDMNGLDATSIFFSYHSERVWKLLRSPEFEKKHLIPETEAVQKMRRDEAGGYDFHCEFHIECKNVLSRYLARRKATYGKHFDDSIVALWTLFWCLMPVLSYSNMLFQGGTLLSALLVGLSFSGATFNLMHPSMHGCICNVQPIKSVLDSTFTIFSGGSCPVWRQRHCVWHHGNTNTAKDTDKHSHPYLRLHPHQEKKWWFAYQHIYFPVLAFVNIGLSQFLNLEQMWNTTPAPGLFRRSECNKYWLALVVWICLGYVIPLYSFGWSAVPLIIVFQTVGSACATYNIIINHIFEGAHTAVESYNQSFAKMQVASSANHSSGSMLAAFLTGGLNQQLEHHLFPSLAVHHLPLIAPEIKKLCAKHKVPYNEFSYPGLVASMHKTLYTYGTCDESAHLPGLGDYHALMEAG